PSDAQIAALVLLQPHGEPDAIVYGARRQLCEGVEGGPSAIMPSAALWSPSSRKACTAHSILVIAYHVLRDSQSYRELGGDYFDRLNTDRLTRYHIKRLAALGYAVTLDEMCCLTLSPPLFT